MTADRTFLYRLLVLALAVRLAAIVLYPGINYYGGISRGYVEVMENVLSGRGAVISVDTATLSAPMPNWSYEPFIDRPLGYLLFLLPVFALTRSLIALQVLEALVASAGVVLLWRLGQRLVDERVARTGAILAALWPLAIRFDIVLLPDAVVGPFLLLSLWLLVKGLQTSDRWPWHVGAGLALGLAMTMRADVMLLPAAIAAALAMLGHWRATLRRCVLLAAGVAIVVGAHTWRNAQVTHGEIVPLGLGSGISMWEGISQFGDTLGTVYGDGRMVQREGYRNWAYPHGVARERQRMAEAVRIIRDHPVFYAGVMLRRLTILLKPDGIVTRAYMPNPGEYELHGTGRAWMEYLRSYPVPFLLQAVIVIGQLVALILAFVGIEWRRVRLHLLPAAVIAYYILIHMITNAEARYFYPVLPLVLLLAANGWHRIRAKGVRSAA